MFRTFYQRTGVYVIIFLSVFLRAEFSFLKIKNATILIVLNIICLLEILVISFLPDNVSRIILGLPIVLFFPGYTLLAALFPRKESLSYIERVALSFGVSIAVVPLIGLVLNYTPWGIRLYPIIISLFIFILAMSFIGWYRGRKLAEVESISLHLNIKVPSLSHLWSEQSLRDKIITVVLAVLVIGAVGTLIYVGTRPRYSEKFTEFYILNDQGKAENYPSKIYLGDSAKVIIGIVNHEGATTAYRVAITLDGADAGSIGPVNVDAEQKLEQNVTIAPTHQGDKEELLFSLYKGDSATEYENVHLWISVTQ